MDLETRAIWSRRPHPGQKYRHGWIPVKGLIGLIERDGDVTDDARHIYGGRFGGMGVQVTSGAMLDGQLRVSARLSDRMGRKAGRVLRVLTRRGGQLVAEHHLRLEIPKLPKASRVLLGLGGPVVGVPIRKHTDTFAAHDFLQSYDAHLDRWYRAAGVSIVETHVAPSDSFYWALRGDQEWADGVVPAAIVARLCEWANSKRPLRRAEARRMLARIEAGDIPSPYELASLVSGGDLFEGTPWIGVRELDDGEA